MSDVQTYEDAPSQDGTKIYRRWEDGTIQVILADHD